MSLNNVQPSNEATEANSSWPQEITKLRQDLKDTLDVYGPTHIRDLVWLIEDLMKIDCTEYYCENVEELIQYVAADICFIWRKALFPRNRYEKPLND